MPARDSYFYVSPRRGSYEFAAREERIYGPTSPPRGGETDRGEIQTQETNVKQPSNYPPGVTGNEPEIQGIDSESELRKAVENAISDLNEIAARLGGWDEDRLTIPKAIDRATACETYARRSAAALEEILNRIGE